VGFLEKIMAFVKQTRIALRLSVALILGLGTARTSPMAEPIDQAFEQPLAELSSPRCYRCVGSIASSSSMHRSQMPLNSERDSPQAPAHRSTAIRPSRRVARKTFGCGWSRPRSSGRQDIGHP
jgi:hypothetical protein